MSLTYRILDTSNVPTAGCPEPRLSLKNFDDPAAFYQTPEFLKTNAISTATSFDQTDFALRNPVIQSTAVDTSGECNIFSTETSIDYTKDNTIHELGT